jgi:two-component system torCAD operon response regulator TorR
MTVNEKYHLLIVEDEPVTRTRLGAYFSTEGYQVSEAENAAQMQLVLDAGGVDLVLLDINLPDDDGLVLAREIRANSNLGIILVTGRSDEIDRIVGLEIGADDYVTKPFNPRELLARVKNILRRSESQSLSNSTPSALNFEGWVLDTQKRQLTDPQGSLVTLTKGEFELLTLLASQPGTVITRERFLNQMSHRSWGTNDRTVDVLIARLRKKLDENNTACELIKTIHGEGYLFTAQVN